MSRPCPLSRIRFVALLGLALLGSQVAWAAEAGTDLRFHKIKVNKVLFLGNSITLHGPKADIGWEANWGMAASSPDKDYVHRILQAITAVAGKEPQSMVTNIADFERQFGTYDVKTSLSKELAFGADLVIVAIGENVPALTTDEMKKTYGERFTALLKTLQETSHPTIVVRSCFGPEPAKDGLAKQACEAVGGIYVDAGPLAKDEANYARSERKIAHGGVAGHPGDRGMQAIADVILQAIVARAETGTDLRFHKMKANKVLFLGNSITLHGPATNIGWEGNWGMAASSPEKDYVHRVLQGIAAVTGKEPQSMVANIADFERQYGTYDIQKSLNKELAFQADIVIVAIGENVAALTTDEMKEKYGARFTALLKTLQETSHPVIIVRSSFWHDPTKDGLAKQACEAVGGLYVDNSTLDKEEANYARSERKFSHAGVAAHPGDRGMQAIADTILQVLTAKAKGE